jgi:hypothetical protein
VINVVKTAHEFLVCTTVGTPPKMTLCRQPKTQHRTRRAERFQEGCTGSSGRHDCFSERPVLTLQNVEQNQYCIASCDVENYMAQFFDTSFAVDPETGANQRSFVGVSWYLWNHCQTLMNSRMQKFVHETFRPEVWGRVHHSEITTFSNNTCVSKSQRKTRPTLQIISRVRFLRDQRGPNGKSRKGVFGLAISCAQISGGGSVHWDLAAHWMLWRSGPRHTAVSTVPQ